jgi:chromosome segregation ATPase
MLKFKSASKNVSVFLLFFLSLLYSSEISVKELEEILNTQSLKINGYINNLQVSPFNKELMSFEVTYDNDKTVKLYLFNVRTKNIFQVESSSFTGETKSKRKYYLQDKGIQWHPYKNWFVFYGNAMGNVEQLYVCRVVVPELINNFAVNGYRVKLDENAKEVKSYCKDPTFDMTGENIYFSRKVQLRDKKAKYNKSYNLTVINDVFKYRDLKFKDVEFKTVLDKRFDQVKPLCSPSDKNLVAYISKKNQPKKGEDYYAEYSINIYNSATTEIVTVDNMDGYEIYSYRWSNTGNHIFYFKALSLLRTPQDFIDDKINQVNLHFAKVNKSAKTTEVLIQTNPKTDILLEDVVSKDNAITFINENNIMLAKYDPYASVYLVDINLWRNTDKKYSQKIRFDREFDTEYPILIGSELFFTSLTYIKDIPVSSINVSSALLKLSGGESQDMLSVKAEIDSGASDDTGLEEEEYSEDEETYEESEESEIIVETKKPGPEKSAAAKKAVTEKVVETKKPSNDQKIAELEGQKSKLNVDLTKLDKQISDETIKIETIEGTIKSLTKESTDLLDRKNLYLESINKLKTDKIASLEGEQKQTGIKTKIAKLESDKLTLQNEILKLENTVLTEKNVLTTLEVKKNSNDIEKTKITGVISNLKIEMTKTLQTGNKVASFELQLKELQLKNNNIDLEIKKLSQNLLSNQNNLRTYEKLFSDKDNEKKSLSVLIDKLKNDKLMTMQQGKLSQIKAKESSIIENKQKLVNLGGQISSSTQSIESENKNISDFRNKITKLNDEKLVILSTINELKSKKASAAKEVVAVKKEEPKKVESKKAEPVEKDEYSEEEEGYGEDSSVDEDVFEDVETPTVNRRGRR